MYSTVAGALIVLSGALGQAPTDRVDLYGDPLPADAIARLGTVRYRWGGFLHFQLDGNMLTSGGVVLESRSDRQVDQKDQTSQP